MARGDKKFWLPYNLVKIAGFVQFKVMGESEILSPLEFGVNSRFSSVLSDRGARNSESFRIWFK